MHFQNLLNLAETRDLNYFLKGRNPNFFKTIKSLYSSGDQFEFWSNWNLPISLLHLCSPRQLQNRTDRRDQVEAPRRNPLYERTRQRPRRANPEAEVDSVGLWLFCSRSVLPSSGFPAPFEHLTAVVSPTTGSLRLCPGVLHRSAVVSFASHLGLHRRWDCNYSIIEVLGLKNTNLDFQNEFTQIEEYIPIQFDL